MPWANIKSFTMIDFHWFSDTCLHYLMLCRGLGLLVKSSFHINCTNNSSLKMSQITTPVLRYFICFSFVLLFSLCSHFCSFSLEVFPAYIFFAPHFLLFTCLSSSLLLLSLAHTSHSCLSASQALVMIFVFTICVGDTFRCRRYPDICLPVNHYMFLVS